MLEGKSRGSHALIIWGAFILFIGVVILLQVTGVLEWQIWGTLWKFWPVLIILAGISILLSRLPAWVLTVSTVVILGICLWISVLPYKPSLSHDVILVEQKFTYPVLGVERVNAGIKSAAGLISITDLTRDENRYLCEITDSRDAQDRPEKRIISMQTDFRQQDGTVSVNVEPVNQRFWEDWPVFWGLEFNKQVPLTLDVTCDGSRVNLRLVDLYVEALHLEMNASSGWLRLPSSTGQTVIDIDLNVSNLEITVSEGVAVRIKADINLGIFSIDRERFQRQGDYFVSPGYESAANRVELNIICDVSRLVIK